MKTLFILDPIKVSKLLLYFFIFIYSSCLFAQSFNINTANCPPMEHELTPSPFSSQVDGITYFWYFGDEQWGISTSADLLPTTHYYLSNTNYPVYVEATPTSTTTGNYDDDDEPERFYFGTNTILTDFSHSVSACSTSSPAIDWVSPDPALSIMTNRSLVKEDIVTYIVKYCNTCTPEPLNGKVSFKYDSDQLDQEVDLLVGGDFTTIPTSPKTMTGTDVTYEYTFTALPFRKCRYYLIRLKVSDTVISGDNITVDVSCNNGTNCNPNFDTLSQLVVQSHDPNSITGNMDFSCQGTTKKITFVIKFQNDGKGNESNVTVNNFISQYFNINSLKVRYPENPLGTFPATNTTSNARELSWTLNSNFLKNSAIKGTRNPDYMIHFPDSDTYDYLVYDIEMRQPHDLRACDAIINQAEIIFKGQASMFTNEAITTIGCFPVSPGAHCDSCEVGKTDTIIRLPEKIYSCDPVELSVDPTIILPGVDSDYNYVWYPAYGLSNLTKQKPLAYPSKTMNYYCVATKDCSRVVFHQRVKFVKCNNPHPWPWPWYWPWIGLGLAVIGLVYFIVKYLIGP